MTTATITEVQLYEDDCKLVNMANENAARFGHIVKVIREELSVSVAQLVLATGISRKRFDAIERGCPTSQAEYDLIARAFAGQIIHKTTRAQ